MLVSVLLGLSLFLPCVFVQYFEHVEEAEWAVQVLKTSGKPVCASLCIGPDGDLNGVSPGDCAVRLVKAGMGLNLDREREIYIYIYLSLYLYLSAKK